MELQTIVAPMTPSGVSAVAAIRVSGPGVRGVVRALFGGNACDRLESHRARLGVARWPSAVPSESCKSTIDSLLYIFFEGPSSYTGEDVLELYPHGNPLIVQELMQAIRSVDGVRLAKPGEFTRRAFLNGKMDLIQAESVADVIHSANRDELKNAQRLLSGALSQKVVSLASQIKDISARLELDVDFSEEEADPDYSTWRTRIEEIRLNVESILKSFRGKANLGKLPLVVLYGAPNAGKSSLVNALLGEDRILVSDVAGTTRDFVEVRLFLEGGEIRLVDTAGIAETASDALDALSMEKSRQVLAEADLKILLVDGTCETSKPGDNHFNLPAQVLPDFVVYTKQDLNAKPSDEAACLETEKHHVSSRTGFGLSELKSAINGRVFENRKNSEDLWITSEREKECLEEALGGIDRALELLRTNPAVELLAFEMQLVRRALQSVVGEISSEDVLQSIFAGFCIGK